MTTIICRQISNDEELAQCFDIRRKVFVQEQHLFEDTDIDDHDGHAIYLAAFFQNRIIGTVRMYGDDAGNWWGGRLAVLKKYRGRAGRELVLAAVAEIKLRGADHFYAHIFEENLNFFKIIGWRQIGKSFLMLGRPHILIEADIR